MSVNRDKVILWSFWIFFLVFVSSSLFVFDALQERTEYGGETLLMMLRECVELVCAL